MTNGKNGTTDGGGRPDEEQSGFVFAGDSKDSTEAPSTGGTAAGGEGVSIDGGTLTATIALVAVLVVIASLGWLVAGGFGGLLGGDGSNGGVAPDDTATGTIDTPSRGPAATDGTTAADDGSDTNGSSGTTTEAGPGGGRGPTATPSTAATAAPTTTATEASSTRTTTAGTETSAGTSAANRLPSVDALTIEDRSTDGGNATVVLDVGWRVSDPDGDLGRVRVRLTTGTDTLSAIGQRTFEARGSESSGNTTFTVENGSLGAPYEVAVIAEDRAGNVAPRLRLEIADGEDDP
jgi:hypothetical protein